jgi:hypothetical protein
MKGDLVHFEIPANDPEKLAAFYTKVLGWMIDEPMPDMSGYRMIHTSEEQEVMGGGLYKKTMPEQAPGDYYDVESIEVVSGWVREAGGQVVMEKMAVPGWGYFAICLDPEGNPFGIWLTDESATAP